MTTLEIPRHLPEVKNLSVSSMETFLRCPEKWRRRYIEKQYEPSGGAMTVGSVIHSVEAFNYGQKIDSGEDISVEQACDEFDAGWANEKDQGEIDWGEKLSEGEWKDQGLTVLRAYHETVAPSVLPVRVEREFTLRPPGVEWSFKGYIDLEERVSNPVHESFRPQTAVSDLKVIGKKLNQAEADSNRQPAAYLAARRREGDPAPFFRYHVLQRTKAGSAYFVDTERTDAQVDAFELEVLRVAAEIAWRAEYENWHGAAPGSWWCGERMCGYWSQCPFGGAR